MTSFPHILALVAVISLCGCASALPGHAGYRTSQYSRFTEQNVLQKDPEGELRIELYRQPFFQGRPYTVSIELPSSPPNLEQTSKSKSTDVASHCHNFAGGSIKLGSLKTSMNTVAKFYTESNCLDDELSDTRDQSNGAIKNSERDNKKMVLQLGAPGDFVRFSKKSFDVKSVRICEYKKDAKCWIGDLIYIL